MPRVGPVKHTGDNLEGAPGSAATHRSDINPGHLQLESITKTKVPGLSELIKIEAVEALEEEDEDEEDRLRRPAMRDTALAYGARGGLSYTSREINLMLRERASKLDRIYDFTGLIIRGPDNVVVLPPVISEAKKSYEVHDAGKTLRIADDIYEIISQAKFTPNAPLWHSYLLRDYSAPNEPPMEILPRTPNERKLWEKYVRQGWETGVKQANDIFQMDLNRLDRDYDGMVRYKRLLAEGKVSAPMLAKAPLGVTGDGSSMRVNDRAVRITRDPQLQTDPSLWSPTIENGPAADYATPYGSVEVRDFPTHGDRQY
nr:type IV secretory system conjugative DNA transfer family protein [Sulfitobacter sp. R18_1]